MLVGLSAVVLGGCKPVEPTQVEINGTMDMVFNIAQMMGRSLDYGMNMQGFSNEVNKETMTDTYTFDKLDVVALFESIAAESPLEYTEMSGSLILGPEHITGDLTLKGGPIKTFVIDNAADVKILANGFACSYDTNLKIEKKSLKERMEEEDTNKE